MCRKYINHPLERQTMKGKSDIESTSYRSRFHNFSFQNISYSVNKDTVKLLDDVSGICQGGQMLASKCFRIHFL